MKKLFSLAIAMLAASAISASAFDPKDLLNGLGGGSSDKSETTDSKSSSGLLDALGGFVNNVTANSKFTVDDLVGSWSYTSPAVSFQSENALKNIGGAGAATAVESKLEPYYTKLGFNKTTLTVAEDHTFTLKMGVLTLKGTVEKESKDSELVFNFNAFGKISLGKVNAHATKSGSTLNLTFDATRMVQILTKVSSVLNSTAVNTLASLLNSYDGIYMGFKLKKDAK